MKFRHSILGDMKTKGNSFSEESGRGAGFTGKVLQFRWQETGIPGNEPVTSCKVLLCSVYSSRKVARLQD